MKLEEINKKKEEGLSKVIKENFEEEIDLSERDDIILTESVIDEGIELSLSKNTDKGIKVIDNIKIFIGV